MLAECGIAMYAGCDTEQYIINEDKPSSMLCRFTAQGELVPPTNLNEALSRPTESANWRSGCLAELNSLSSKGVFSVVDLPSGAVAIPSMWVFAYKVTPSGTIERFKSRLVAKGYAQKPGVDFKETWAPTGSLTVLRCLFAYAAAYN
jgi:hypothetical protein